MITKEADYLFEFSAMAKLWDESIDGSRDIATSIGFMGVLAAMTVLRLAPNCLYIERLLQSI